MSKSRRSVMRRQGFKCEPLATISLRIESEIYERCEWAAAARGIKRSQFIRDALANATHDAKPPIPRSFRGVEAPREEIAEWERVAGERGKTVNALIVDWMNTVVKWYDEKKGQAK